MATQITDSYPKSIVGILTIILTIISSGASEELSFSAAIETFWSVSCEFSDLMASRNKRSVLEEPNFGDPIKLFHYLYPLADMTLEDYAKYEPRSHSPSTWLQDLVDLWGSECHSRNRRAKRDIQDEGNDESGSQYVEDEIREESVYPIEHHGILGKKNATMPNPPVAAAKKEKKVIADTDTFFAQYGGDIEYFFPLIAFGIPFDGEITFLGFHGFKGLFPYK